MSTSPLWNVLANHIDPNNYFGVTVANGMIGLVSSHKPMQIREVILNGVYDRYQRGRVSNILQGFSHLNLDIMVDGRTPEKDDFQGLLQDLDMREAILKTDFEIFDKVTVSHEMLALRHLPFTSMVKVTVTARADTDITFSNNLFSPNHLQDVRNYYSEIDRPHVKIPLLSSVAKSPSGQLTLAASNSYIFEEGKEEPRLIHEDWDFNRHLIKFTISLKKGESYTFSMVGSICTTAHFSDPQNEAERLSVFAKLEGVDRLYKRHKQGWDKLWASDIQIEGDDEVQKEMRFLLYHLYSFVRKNSALSLSPVGLSGLGYNGHVFWDTEMWMYPPLLALNPGLAKSLLDYRFDRLDAAKKNALAHGYHGAMYPWESADDGSEQTPVWALTGPFQHHITGCVAWAFWKYYQVTQDIDYLREKGWPVLKAAAQFWSERVERNGPGQYDIRNVIGANEFEENIDNNAFTNGIAKTVLRYATLAAELLGVKADPDWLHVAENIPILQFSDGTTRENETYEGAEIKQSDANLLSYPLEVIRDKEHMRKDLEFYAPRMSPDGPAMGLSTIATLYARLGDTETAYKYFLESYRPNGVPPFNVLAECAGGKGVSPFFITGAGGTLQVILFGFGGLEITDHGIIQEDQNLPAHWKSLKFTGIKTLSAEKVL